MAANRSSPSRLRAFRTDIPLLGVKASMREAQMSFQQSVPDGSNCLVLISHFLPPWCSRARSYRARR
jgi:hypothetical protein